MKFYLKSYQTEKRLSTILLASKAISASNFKRILLREQMSDENSLSSKENLFKLKLLKNIIGNFYQRLSRCGFKSAATLQYFGQGKV
ncbi:CLUMA_CG017837, isoform A [Clunio marinus]|uniref:CLUMA_CG017837, isoform A n=1 Tax=Clunio marinus TaxID=568069 RepID=A0A1J1IX45_9DIPT|nr:CLUMA_CG017837, isoform A [Clunio marinus]